MRPGRRLPPGLRLQRSGSLRLAAHWPCECGNRLQAESLPAARSQVARPARDAVAARPGLPATVPVRRTRNRGTGTVATEKPGPRAVRHRCACPCRTRTRTTVTGPGSRIMMLKAGTGWPWPDEAAPSRTRRPCPAAKLVSCWRLSSGLFEFKLAA